METRLSNNMLMVRPRAYRNGNRAFHDHLRPQDICGSRIKSARTRLALHPFG